jgi:hypothetical protein
VGVEAGTLFSFFEAPITLWVHRNPPSQTVFQTKSLSLSDHYQEVTIASLLFVSQRGRGVSV